MTEPQTPATEAGRQLSRTPVALPTLAEVREWDRDHRRECQEYHCTLDHRMLAFADWYIVIERGYRERVRARLAAAVRALAAPKYDGDRWTKDCEHGWDTHEAAVLAILDAEAAP